MKNRELYKYEYSDLGDIETLLSDYVSGKVDFPELLKKKQEKSQKSDTTNNREIDNLR